MRCKVLLRAVWKNMLCVPDFGKVSPAAEDSAGRKKHTAVKAEWKFTFLWFYDFMIFYLHFIILL